MRKRTLWLIAMMLLSVGFVQAQQQVSGTITDAKTGQPMPGVSIKIKGTEEGTTTAENGFYSITLTKGGALVFSFVGYQTLEIKGPADNLNIRLEPATSDLAEVIVTGFGQQIKRELTGNIARVKGKEIENLPVASVDQALQGRAAGVMVNSQSGKLGQAVTVRVRGNSSISASSQPLYVVDGTPITTDDQSSYGGNMNPLIDLNPNDIESIEILKDASAGAIYGSRAANGVVLITTKRGKNGKTNISVNLQGGYSEATKRVDMLNSSQYADLYLRAAGYRDDIAGIDRDDPDSWTNYAKSIMQYYSYDQWESNPSKTYNWQDQAFRRGDFKQADVQMSGGNDRTKYFASLQYQDQVGTIIGNDLKRTSGRLNLDQKVNDWLSVGFNMGLANTVSNRLPGDNAFSNPLQATALMPMTPFTDPNTGLEAGAPPGDVNIPVYYNPVLSVNYGNYVQETFRNLSNAYGIVKLAPWLKFHTELGLDILNQTEEGYFQSQTVRNQSRAVRGVGSNNSAFITNVNTNNYFNFNNSFGEHTVDATLGMQYQNSRSRYNFTEGLDFPSDAYQKIASAATKSDGSSSESNFRFLSYFARANYKYADRYLLSLSIRRDGSSRFGSNSRYGWFPAASVGWVLTQENFMQRLEAISFLKLRASYGIVGNAEIGNFPQLGLFAGDAGYAGNAGQRPSQIGNPDLRWEETAQWDAGLDFGFLGNRITGEFDVYKKKTTGLLLNVNIPGTTGFTSVVRNVGSLENKGIELVLNTNNLVGKFTWSTNINLAYNKGKVLDIQGQVIEGGISSMNRVMEGQPIGVFYAVQYAGVNPDNGDALFYLNNENADGTLDKSTVTNSGFNSAQRVVVGDPNPDYIFGMTNNFGYKGFDLSVFLNGVAGNDVNIYGMGRYSSANFLYEDNQTVDQMDAWNSPGQVTSIPQARLYRTNGSQASSRYIVDGSYVRLRNITFGYNFSSDLLRKIRIQRLRLYASAQNLLTFTKYPYWDPEVNADSFDSNIAKGNDFYTPPQPKTILFGINIGL